MDTRRIANIWLATAVFAAAAGGAFAQPPAPAQQPAGPPNALQGFAQNRDQPVQIDAAQLEVRDKEKIATFSGNVRVVQGDTTMRSKTLAVFYDGDGSTANALTSAQPGPGGQQRIKRLEVKGGVKVCQNDQIVTGDSGVFDMKANTVTLVGNVVLTKEQNVLKGEKLVVDLTTGAAKIDGGKGGVSALLIPSSIQDEKKAAEQKPKQPIATQNKPAPCT
ncbi:MAG: LPS ABC transporter substrate-binding protein LptA [Xanthobacteraceae bacterium]|nr:LPS ABC transporter substrate-binding protein LptA [Xanthobacteraceae bacterium]